MILAYFQGKPFNITVIQVYAPNTKAEEAEANQFYEDLQGLLELAPKIKNVLFIMGDWSANIRSQKIPGVRGQLVLAVQNIVGQSLIVFANKMH